MKTLIQIVDVLEQCEKVKGTIQKRDLIASLKTHKSFHIICEWVFSLTPAYFFFSHFPDKTSNNFSEEEIMASFQKIVAKLGKREFSPQEAKYTVSAFLSMLPDRKMQRRFMNFFNKQLAFGIGYSYVSDFALRPKSLFQLACGYHAISSDELGYIAIEPKIDGIRGMAFLDDSGTPQFITRGHRAISYDNISHLVEPLISYLKSGYVFDGELYAGSWGETASIVNSKGKHPKAGKLKFVIFDCIAKTHLGKEYPEPYYQRRSFLEKMGLPLFAENSSATTVLIPVRIVPEEEQEITECMEEFSSFEGLMVKNINASYSPTRNANWQKIKEFKSEDFQIVGAFFGGGNLAVPPSPEIKEKLLNWRPDLAKIINNLNCALGSIEIALPAGGRASVGSGFTLFDRYAFWTLHLANELVGTYAEVAFQPTENISLRFPVFHKLRLDL